MGSFTGSELPCRVHIPPDYKNDAEGTSVHLNDLLLLSYHAANDDLHYNLFVLRGRTNCGGTGVYPLQRVLQPIGTAMSDCTHLYRAITELDYFDGVAWQSLSIY